MAIIKQTDTPTAGANVYADLADLASYASLRNIDLSNYDSTQQEAALFISAQDWVDGEHQFKGELVELDQSMKLPTTEVLINTDITTANCMTAVQQLKGLLYIEVKSSDALGQVTMSRKKLDKLETETEYADGSSMIVGSTYSTTKADNKLKPYLSYGGGIPLLRV